MAKALIVSVTFEDRGDGGLRVHSDDVPGLYLSSADRDAVLRDVVPAVELLFEKNHGIKVEANPIAPNVESMRDSSPAVSPAVAAIETGKISVRQAEAA